MRNSILKRIQFFIEDSTSSFSNGKQFIGGGLQTAIKIVSNEKKRNKIIEEGYFTSDFDFNSLNDEDLTEAFEKIVRCYYKPWA